MPNFKVITLAVLLASISTHASDKESTEPGSPSPAMQAMSGSAERLRCDVDVNQYVDVYIENGEGFFWNENGVFSTLITLRNGRVVSDDGHLEVVLGSGRRELLIDNKEIFPCLPGSPFVFRRLTHTDEFLRLNYPGYFKGGKVTSLVKTLEKEAADRKVAEEKAKQPITEEELIRIADEEGVREKARKLEAEREILEREALVDAAGAIRANEAAAATRAAEAEAAIAGDAGAVAELDEEARVLEAAAGALAAEAQVAANDAADVAAAQAIVGSSSSSVRHRTSGSGGGDRPVSEEVLAAAEGRPAQPANDAGRTTEASSPEPAMVVDSVLVEEVVVNGEVVEEVVVVEETIIEPEPEDDLRVVRSASPMMVIGRDIDRYVVRFADGFLGLMPEDDFCVYRVDSNLETCGDNTRIAFTRDALAVGPVAAIAQADDAAVVVEETVIVARKSEPVAESEPVVEEVIVEEVIVEEVIVETAPSATDAAEMAAKAEETVAAYEAARAAYESARAAELAITSAAEKAASQAEPEEVQAEPAEVIVEETMTDAMPAGDTEAMASADTDALAAEAAVVTDEAALAIAEAEAALAEAQAALAVARAEGNLKVVRARAGNSTIDALPEPRTVAESAKTAEELGLPADTTFPTIGESYPLVAISRGGNLRDSGSLDGKLVGSTKNGDIVEVLRPINSYYKDFRWFEIKTDNQTAYQWGGVLCSPLEPVLGMRDCVE